jgi:SAM-dependent methyltransferase
VGSHKGATQRTRKFAAFGTGSESKDKIENETKRLVCSGKITLSDAQKTSPWRSRLFGAPEQTLDRSGVEPGMQVLEIGPGPGVYTVLLARRVAEQGAQGSITCVEIQPEMIEMLRERLHDAGMQNVEVIRGDGRQIPSPENSFDLVFLAGMLGETPDLQALFNECTRVLKPGGILAVTEQVNDPDFRLPSPIRKLAANAGLEEEGQEGLAWWTYTARYRK